MMTIKEMYNQNFKIYNHGVQGYHVDHKYSELRQDPNIPKKQLKRGSYLQDYARLHGAIPGPGVYEYAKDQWPKKTRAKSAKPPKKKTYIDQIMQQCKKQKKPSPCHYKLGKSLKELDKQRKQNKHKKTNFQDRMTYLDAVQYQATQTPGVGKYNTRTRPNSSSGIRRLKPEEWRKKHEQQRKNKKPAKQPDMGTYDPTEAKSYMKKSVKEGEWNRVERFKTEKSGSGLGPGKYLQVDNWTGKKSVEGSRIPYKSTYYH